MDGHGATLGGAIVDGGKFDWMAHAAKFPGLCTPDDRYHGITYACLLSTSLQVQGRYAEALSLLALYLFDC